MRAWIETLNSLIVIVQFLVARRVRAWIETLRNQLRQEFDFVARRVRAWIETFRVRTRVRTYSSRPPCAGVD